MILIPNPSLRDAARSLLPVRVASPTGEGYSRFYSELLRLRSVQVCRTAQGIAPNS